MISILLSLILRHWFGEWMHQRHEYLFRRWYIWLSESGLSGRLHWLVTVFFWPLLVTVLLWLADSWLLDLALSLWVLLYTMGRSQQKPVNRSGVLTDDVDMKDKGVYARYVSRCFESGDSCGLCNRADFITEISYAYMHHVYYRFIAVLFWFALLKAPGALLFYMAYFYYFHCPVCNGSVFPVMLMNWLPERLFALLLALMSLSRTTLQKVLLTFWQISSNLRNPAAFYLRYAIPLSPDDSGLSAELDRLNRLLALTGRVRLVWVLLTCMTGVLLW